MKNRLLTFTLSLIFLLGVVTPVYAEELLWTEQAGQLICKELSEGLKLEPDVDLLSVPGMKRFEKQIQANENPELLVFGQMIRRCPLLTFQSMKEPADSTEEA